MGWNRTAVAPGATEVADYQTDLFAAGTPGLSHDAAVERRVLDDRSWLDVSSRWLNGADELLVELASRLRWTAAQRPMYGQMVDEPRLGAQMTCPAAAAPAVVNAMAARTERAIRRGPELIMGELLPRRMRFGGMA